MEILMIVIFITNSRIMFIFLIYVLCHNIMETLLYKNTMTWREL